MSTLMELINEPHRRYRLDGSGVTDWRVTARIFGWRQPNGDNVIAASATLGASVLCREAHLAEVRDAAVIVLHPRGESA